MNELNYIGVIHGELPNKAKAQSWREGEKISEMVSVHFSTKQND
jgi:hypothetical protein